MSRTRACAAPALVACLLMAGSPRAEDDREATAPARPAWRASAPLFGPPPSESGEHVSLKDPSVVRHDGAWHLFSTVRGTERSHRVEHLTFSSWERADDVERRFLDIHPGFFCAPQVFYFRPEERWYLICQASDPAWDPEYGAAFATTTDLSDPDAWTRLAPMGHRKADGKSGLDFWVICDDAKAHLFFTTLDGRMWREETSLDEFPKGWSEPQLALRADIFEASHIYALDGQDGYLAVIEAQGGPGWRNFRAYRADRLDGDWRPLHATRDDAFAGMGNVTFDGERWTDSISHGELLRSTSDERLRVDPARLRFVFQGVLDRDRAGKGYGAIPWRLGLLEAEGTKRDEGAEGDDPPRADAEAAPATKEEDAAPLPTSWRSWRGPLGTGASPDADPPITWSDTQNIRWRTELPGLGHSSPVVAGDTVWVTSAVPEGEALAEPIYDDAPGSHDNLPVTHRQRFVVIAVERASGEVRWETTVHRALPEAAGHVSGSLASASPVTDGSWVWAFFGSHGLHAIDPSGEVRWSKQLGQMATKHAHGEGSSPALHEDTVIVNWDHEGDSFVVAFEKTSGEERWRELRDEGTSWSSPLVLEGGERDLVVISATRRIRAYDITTGDVVWECGGLSRNVVATPVAADGMLFAASSYDTQAMLALRIEGAEGDITGTDRVVWSRRRGTPYVPSPLLYRGSLYFLHHYQSILHRVDAASGEERIGPFRLPGVRNIYASPVAAAGRVYVTDRAGTTVVMTHADAPRVLAVNRIDDRVNASAALVGRELFLRGEESLWAIAEGD